MTADHYALAGRPIRRKTAKAASQRALPVAWDPAAYAAHSAVQQEWARELIARMALRGDERVLDVGCGDGKVTAEIAQALPRGAVTGIDASPEMIRFARKAFPKKTAANLQFRVMDARHIQLDQDFDLVFSNAALHWVDDHQAFLRGASTALRPGGRLMVSCGGKGNAHDVFLAIRSRIRLPHWRGYFRKLERPYHFYGPDDYRKWLPKFGFTSAHVHLAAKDMTLNGPAGLAAWLRTTWLPYTQRVPEAAREQLIDSVVVRYMEKQPADHAGRLHVRMVRLEIEAVKKGRALSPPSISTGF